VDVDVGCVPIELPMRELILELIRLFELAAGCFVTIDGLVLAQLVELVVGCRDPLELERAELLVPILIEVDLRAFVLVVGREGLIRLDITLVELLLGVILLGWRMLGVLAELFRFIELELLELARGWLDLELEGALLRFLLALDDCWALGAGAGFDDCCFA